MRSGFFAGMFAKSLVVIGSSAVAVTASTIITNRAHLRREMRSRIDAVSDVFALTRELVFALSVGGASIFLEQITKEKLRAVLTDACACQKMFEAVNRTLLKLFVDEYQLVYKEDSQVRNRIDDAGTKLKNHKLNEKYVAIRNKIFNDIYEVMAEKINTIEDLNNYVSIIDAFHREKLMLSEKEKIAQFYNHRIDLAPYWNANEFKEYIFKHKNIFALFADSDQMFNYFMYRDYLNARDVVQASEANISYMLKHARTPAQLHFIINNCGVYAEQVKAALLDENNENITQILAKDLEAVRDLIYILDFLQDDKNHHLKTGENHRKFIARLGDHPVLNLLRRDDHRKLLSMGVDMEAAVYVHRNDRPTMRLT